MNKKERLSDGQVVARCGDCKAAGNYAADLESMYEAKKPGSTVAVFFWGLFEFLLPILPGSKMKRSC